MVPDWNYVKKTTLWQYEELLKKLKFVTAYPAIWQAYNQDMAQAADFARRLFPERDIAGGEFPARVLGTLARLQAAGIRNWSDLLARTGTREDCTAFTAANDLNFEEFIDLLNFLLRWAFPFQTAARELLEHENPQEMACYEALKAHRLMHSFDLLEEGRNPQGRRSLAQRTGLPLDFMTALVHRADVARLPYVRRKTLLPVCGAGYNTLARIAGADLAQMEADMDAYFRRVHGKPFENYKSVIVLKLMVENARALPVLVEG